MLLHIKKSNTVALPLESAPKMYLTRCFKLKQKINKTRLYLCRHI